MFTLGSIRAGAACVALAASSVASAEVDFQLPVEERGSAWFAPTLVTSNRPMCAAALEAERATFFAPDDPAPEIPGLIELSTENRVIEDPDVAVLEDYPLELTLTLPDRSRAFLHFFRYAGCGGACETGAVGIDDERIPKGMFERGYEFSLPDGVPLTHRYGPDRWRLFKASDGDFYLRGTLDDHTQWYRIAAADRFELVCNIALKPDTSSGKGGVYSQRVFDAIESLRVAADRMAGGSGDCGTMATPGRWAQYRAEGLETALYRPWAVLERREYESANSGGDYARIVEQLKLWSLGGVMEYRDFVAYQSQFAGAAAAVAAFYRAKFGWAPARAEQMADAALKGAISSGFGFYEYEPYTGPEEQELRQAILARAPLEQIRSIIADPKEIDHAGQDSILNVAIEYPEALSYLLEKGFNPNIGNAFGKTPLMYAAQYNQVVAAEMLLKAGAEPNATTHPPQYTCEYTISTGGLTPLHYATRYSSARLIQLLLDHGAVTFIRSIGDDGAEYPLDRLQRYAGLGIRDERNPHIAESEVAGLARLLVVPSDAQKHAMATQLVSRARSEYARGDAQKAYQQLRLALLAQPDRPDATADLPLIALRAGYIGPAVSAADRATKTLTSPAALAAAWFNKGLICEQPRGADVFTIDDARCELDTLEPFVKSWKMQASPARANKLRALIRVGATSCGATEAGRHYRLAPKEYYRSFRIYALHRANEKIDVSRIRWPAFEPSGIAASMPGAQVAGVEVVDSFRLGDDAVTLLQVPVRDRNSNPHKISLWFDGRECKAEL